MVVDGGFWYWLNHQFTCMSMLSFSLFRCLFIVSIFFYRLARNHTTNAIVGSVAVVFIFIRIFKNFFVLFCFYCLFYGPFFQLAAKIDSFFLSVKNCTLFSVYTFGIQLRPQIPGGYQLFLFLFSIPCQEKKNWKIFEKFNVKKI